jgi:hypothetical protein
MTIIINYNSIFTTIITTTYFLMVGDGYDGRCCLMTVDDDGGLKISTGSTPVLY